MTTSDVTAFSLTAEERTTFDREGFLLRENVFDAAELQSIGAACEALVGRVLASPRGRKHAVGSYLFERQSDLSMYVKWEPDEPGLLQGIEPFLHLSDELRLLGMDPRLLEPSRTLVGQADIAPFTEKLNLKRARRGGRYILHQDFPYWRDENPVARHVATAMLFLDDATQENGCLEVAPGSHREGVQRTRDAEGFGALEIDPAAFDLNRLVPVEATAGSVVWFGALLVHRSGYNATATDRRALLYSYQPSGYPHAYQLAVERASGRRGEGIQELSE